MAFVTEFSTWPVYMAKLLHPMCSGKYHEVPGLYLGPRALTLHCFIHYNILTKVVRTTNGHFPMVWAPKGSSQEDAVTKLCKLWGSVNKEAGLHYRTRIEAVYRHGPPEAKEVHDERRQMTRELMNKGFLQLACAFIVKSGNEELQKLYQSLEDGADEITELTVGELK